MRSLLRPSNLRFQSERPNWQMPGTYVAIGHFNSIKPPQLSASRVPSMLYWPNPLVGLQLSTLSSPHLWIQDNALIASRLHPSCCYIDMLLGLHFLCTYLFPFTACFRHKWAANRKQLTRPSFLVKWVKNEAC